MTMRRLAPDETPVHPRDCVPAGSCPPPDSCGKEVHRGKSFQCCTWIGSDGVTKIKDCKRITIDPWGPSSAEPLPPTDFHLTGQTPTPAGPEEPMYSHSAQCPSNCQCRQLPPVVTVPLPDGGTSVVAVQPAPGRGDGLCWAIAGGEVLAVPPATPTPIVITVANYSFLRPRHMTISAADPVLPDTNPARFVRVLSVLGVGRQVVGSVAGISGASIDSYAQNFLRFGRDISPITAANAITATVSHTSPNLLNIAADIEGWGQQ